MGEHLELFQASVNVPGVVPHRRDRRLLEAACGQRREPALVGVGVVADRGQAGHPDGRVEQRVPRTGVGQALQLRPGALGHLGPARDHIVGRDRFVAAGRGGVGSAGEVGPARVAARQVTGLRAGIGGGDGHRVAADEERVVEGTDLDRVRPGVDLLGGVGRRLGTGEQITLHEQLPVRAEELHGEVVGRQPDRDRGQGAGLVVGDLEGVLRAAGAERGAGERTLDVVLVVDVVTAQEHLAGDRVDQHRLP